VDSDVLHVARGGRPRNLAGLATRPVATSRMGSLRDTVADKVDGAWGSRGL